VSADNLLGREELSALLKELGAQLDSEGLKAELYVVGGAAMALAYNTRRLTRDVDAVFEPKSRVYEAAARVAADKGLPHDWLNDAVKGLLPGPDPDARPVFEAPGISVSAASPRYLLAMKVAAARIDRDVDDILLLARLCGATTSDEVLKIVSNVWGGTSRLLPKARFLVEELFSADDDG